MELSVENTLEPRVAFLAERLGILPEGMGKVLAK
jgi:hypothetical protein